MTIEDYYNKLYNEEGVLSRIYDISDPAYQQQLIFYPIDLYDEQGNLLHSAKTFDEQHHLTQLLRMRESNLNQTLDLSDIEPPKGKKKK